MPQSPTLPTAEDSHTTTFRLRRSTFERLQDRARQNERTVSGEVRKLIEEALGEADQEEGRASH